MLRVWLYSFLKSSLMNTDFRGGCIHELVVARVEANEHVSVASGNEMKKLQAVPLHMTAFDKLLRVLA